MLVNFLPVDNTSAPSDPGTSSCSAQLSRSSNESRLNDDKTPCRMASREDHDSGSEDQRVQGESGQEPVDSEEPVVEWVTKPPFPESSEV